MVQRYVIILKLASREGKKYCFVLRLPLHARKNAYLCSRMNVKNETYCNVAVCQPQKRHAGAIAQLIMTAMSDECCLNLAGNEHTLHDFQRLITELVCAEDSQYSYRNCLAAMAGDEVVGVCVAYDGALLHVLRHAFVDGARRAFGIDHSGMADETSAGEFYIDSLAVADAYRRRGIARLLLLRTIDKALQAGAPRVGLLVDKANPNAERLYKALGFEYVGDAAWGGHAMKHLQYVL